jgi:hypothetical protein
MAQNATLLLRLCANPECLKTTANLVFCTRSCEIESIGKTLRLPPLCDACGAPVFPGTPCASCLRRERSKRSEPEFIDHSDVPQPRVSECDQYFPDLPCATCLHPPATPPVTAFKAWYENHREELAAKRKRRYHTDAVYRAQILKRGKKQREEAAAYRAQAGAGAAPARHPHVDEPIPEEDRLPACHHPRRLRRMVAYRTHTRDRMDYLIRILIASVKAKAPAKSSKPPVPPAPAPPVVNTRTDADWVGLRTEQRIAMSKKALTAAELSRSESTVDLPSGTEECHTQYEDWGQCSL